MIIGLSGRAGSGKDTVADHLVKHYGFVKLSFASPLKDGLNAMFGWTPAHWEDRVWKEAVIPELGVSPRYLAQTLGTEWGRELVKQDLWPMLAMNKAKQHRKVVIADVRFDNEAQAVFDAGGYVIHLVRGSADVVNAHQSELPLGDAFVDDSIDNNSSVEALLSEAVASINLLTSGEAWQN